MVMEGTGLSQHLQTHGTLPIPQILLSWNPKPVPFRWFRNVLNIILPINMAILVYKHPPVGAKTN